MPSSSIAYSPAMGGVQFTVGSTGIVRGCRFENNYSAQVVSRLGANLLLEDSYLGAGAEVTIDCSAGGKIEAHDNVIEAGTAITIWGLEISQASQMIFSGNDIEHGSGPSVEVRGGGQTEVIELDFSNNFWGTTDTAQIDLWISDELDRDPRYPDRYPIVVYDPIREQSVQLRQRSMGSFKRAFDRARDQPKGNREAP